MSSTGSSVSTNSPAAGGTIGSKVKDVATGKWAVGLAGVVSISLFIASFVSMSQFAGSKDDWNLIQPQITKVLILSLIGTFALIVASLLYYIQDSSRAMYFILVLCCVSLGLSYSALAVAAISR
jgi:hypothetical protein